MLVGALRSAVENGDKGFTSEIQRLKKETSHLELARVCLDSIPQSVSDQGILSHDDLINRFEVVKDKVKEASFVGPNGGMWSFAFSSVLSRLSLSAPGEEGDVEGTFLIINNNTFNH